MIDERFITDRFHDALEAEPETGAFDRLKYTLGRTRAPRPAGPFVTASRRLMTWIAMRLRVGERGRAWALTFTAIVLALAIVAALIGVRSLQHSAPAPVHPGPPLHHNGRLVVRAIDGTLTAVDPKTGAFQTLVAPSAISNPATGLISDAGFSSDGRELAFIANLESDPSKGRIAVLDISSGKARPITTCECSEFSHLAWSPDGSRIAYSDIDKAGRFQIFTVRPDGTGKTQLTHLPTSTWVLQPAWSPDGAHVLFVRWLGTDLSQGAELDIVGSDGSGEAVLLQDPQGPIEPAWSPDGSMVAFATDGPTAQSSSGAPFDFQVWTMRTDGSHRTRIFEGKGCCLNGLGGPAWSPDGTMIAVVSTHGPVSVEGWWLWVMNADGTGTPQPLLQVAPDRPAWQPIA